VSKDIKKDLLYPKRMMHLADEYSKREQQYVQILRVSRDCEATSDEMVGI
jgi:hypothetical protein